MNSDAKTVAELLELDPTAEPATYRIGDELPTKTVPRSYPKPARRIDRSVLAPFYDAVVAGMPDHVVASRTGATTAQVRRWRTALRIHRKRSGVSAAARLHWNLTDILGPPEPDSKPGDAGHIELARRLFARVGVTHRSTVEDVRNNLEMTARLARKFGVAS